MAPLNSADKMSPFQLGVTPHRHSDLFKEFKMYEFSVYVYVTLTTY